MSVSLRAEGDNCNYDGYANHPVSVAVGALTNYGTQSSYSEDCAALMVTAPSSGGSDGIHTTDLLGANGYSASDCTISFGGTSAASPLAAGVVALVLQANPSLGWRDLHQILVETSTLVDEANGGWQTNGAGHKVSHKYGFGLINAGAAVARALNTQPLGSIPLRGLGAPQFDSSGTLHVDLPIPNGAENPGSYVETQYHVTDPSRRVDFVQAVVKISHTTSTDLEIVLTSPSGTKSVLAELHGISKTFIATILTPESLSHPSIAAGAKFGPTLSAKTPVTGYVEPAEPYEACAPLTNGKLLQGTIALVSRGSCSFAQKAVYVSEAGAIAMVVVNSDEGDPVTMADAPVDGVITVPSVMVEKSLGRTILDTFNGGVDVTLELSANLISDDTYMELDFWPFGSTQAWGEDPR